MSLHRVPRVGSRAHSVLLHLVTCGGMSTPAVLLREVQYPRPAADFEASVIGSLVRQGLVAKSGEKVLLTIRGRQLVQPAPVPEADAAAPAPGRYVPPMRPLSSKNRPRLASMRPGSLAYRDIPSRMANVLVDHVEKAAA